MSNLILTITATVSIVNGLVDCKGEIAKYDGCANVNTKTITINADLPPERFKEVFLHEFAHIKYNERLEIAELFEQAPQPRKEDGDSVLEKMDNWFVVFWNYNLFSMCPECQLSKFYLK